MDRQQLDKLVQSLKDEPYESSIYSDQQTILLISTMRSRSSVFAQILGAHPQIDGYREQHLEYYSVDDIIKLRQRVYVDTEGKFSGKYVLDKVADQHMVSPSMFNRDDVHLIFLLRDPDATLKSLASMNARFDWNITSEQAVDLYLGRLAEIIRMAQLLKRPAIFLTSEQLLHATSACFRLLQDKLELDRPLSESYALGKNSLIPGSGDPSEALKSGRLEPTVTGHEDIEIPDNTLAQARVSYEIATGMLRQKCHHIAD